MIPRSVLPSLLLSLSLSPSALEQQLSRCVSILLCEWLFSTSSQSEEVWLLVDIRYTRINYLISIFIWLESGFFFARFADSVPFLSDKMVKAIFTTRTT